MNFTFVWFEINTPFQSCCFCPLKFFVDAKCFCRGDFFIRLFFHCSLYLRCFSTQEIMYTNIHIFWEMLNRVVVGLFRSNMEVKSSKSVRRGIFLFLLFNPRFLRLNDASIVQKYSCQISKLSDNPGVIFFPKEWRSTTFQGRLSSSLHVVNPGP